MCRDSTEDTDTKTTTMGRPTMANALTGERGSCSGRVGPLKTGSVYMFRSLRADDRPVRVVLSVYASTFDRYAVVSQDRRLCRDCGYINLRTSAVSRRAGGVGFQIAPASCDGPALVFRVCADEVNDWLSALRQQDSAAPGAPATAAVLMRRPTRTKMERRPQSLINRNSLLPALVEEGGE